MNLLKSLFRKNVGGYIKAYGLEDWWYGNFNSEERKYITERYRPMRAGQNILIEGNVNNLKEPKSIFLINLALWFNTKKDIDIARRMIVESRKFFDENISYLNQHFYYVHLISHYYLDRDNPTSLQLAIEACENHISISKKIIPQFKKEIGELPTHLGFKQLAIIEEKQKNYMRAIELSEQALSEGWNGDWKKRIERLERKLNKKKL